MPILAGCPARKDEARDLIKQKAEAAKAAAREQGEDFGDVVSKDVSYSGLDAKGRPLWKVGAKVARAKSEKTVDGALEPLEVRLEGATAQLFRDGKPESSFIAPRILFVRNPSGPILTMSGGISMLVPASRLSDVRKTEAASRGAVSLRAKEARVDINKRRVFCPNGATMTQGKTNVVSAVLQTDSRLGVARLGGGIRASAPEGRFSARSAVWNWNTARVQATGGVKAERDGTVLTGARLDADTEVSRGAISGGVRATAKDGKATAQRARFDWRRGTVNASGDVKLEKDGGVLRAQTLDSDKNLIRTVASGGVTLQKDGATLSAREITGYEKLSRAVATGGVTLVREGATMRASRIEAFLKAQRAVASGGVTLVRESATVSAPRVEAWLREKRAIASGGVRLRRADLDVSASRVESTMLGETSQRVVATGGVRARNDDGAVVARRVSWGGGRVLATGDVRLTKGANSIGGDRLDSDDEFQVAQLSGAIEGRGEGANVSAGRIVWRARGGNRGDGGQILATGGARARWKNLVVRAVTLEAAGNGSRAVARGGVVVTSDDGAKIVAQQARYNRAANTVSVPGDVQFFDPARGSQRGRDLVYNLATKTATMRDVKGSVAPQLFDGKKLFQ